MVAKRAFSVCLCAILLSSGSAFAESLDVPRVLPASFTRVVHPIELADQVIPEPINLEAALLEDARQQPEGGSSRFALCRAVNISPKTHGVWEDSDEDTLLWRVPITSPGALSISLGFSRYFMPAGGKLYVYSADHTQVLGPFTARDNQEHGQLWTPLIHSDSVIVELAIPVLEVPEMQVELTYVNHGYRDLRPSLAYQELGDAAICQRNVACSEGDLRRDQIRSVARYQITRTGEGGGAAYWDTGVLLNNTAGDNRAYFLTAFHSFDEVPKDQILTNREKGYAATMVIYWNFEATTCYGSTGSESQHQQGATFRAGNWQSDFTLVELDDAPSPAFNVYYAGWDWTAITPSSGFAIHHPRGDLKKISVENDPLISWSPSIVNGVNYGTCFRVVGWDVGTTETGSSGCPLFNSDKRVVGQLIGGTGTCDAPRVSTFGPLYRSWDGGGTPGTRLSDWLDPLNTGVMFLAGKDPRGSQGAELTTVPQQGNIWPAGDVDWWYFTVPSSATYTIQTSLGTLTDTVIHLYGPNSQTTEIDKNDDIEMGNRASRITRTLSPGKYYVKVRAFSSDGTGTYTIQVRSGSASSCYDSNISSRGTGREWEFTVSSTTTYTFETKAGTLKDTRMYLYGPVSRGDLLAEDDDGGEGLMSKITRTLSPGHYWLHVFAYSSNPSSLDNECIGTFTLCVTTQ